jgi:hypothetical protein
MITMRMLRSLVINLAAEIALLAVAVFWHGFWAKAALCVLLGTLIAKVELLGMTSVWLARRR